MAFREFDTLTRKKYAGKDDEAAHLVIQKYASKSLTIPGYPMEQQNDMEGLKQIMIDLNSKKGKMSKARLDDAARRIKARVDLLKKLGGEVLTPKKPQGKKK